MQSHLRRGCCKFRLYFPLAINHINCFGLQGAEKYIFKLKIMVDTCSKNKVLENLTISKNFITLSLFQLQKANRSCCLFSFIVIANRDAKSNGVGASL